MGTFHAKLLLVDRQVALINSNNIQDRPNIESCTRLEGDIVNSVYDHALISWGNRLNPPLPCLASPAPRTPSSAAFSSGDHSTLPKMTATRLREIASVARKRLQEDDKETEDLDERSRDGWMGGQRRLSLADVVDGVMRRDAGAVSSPSVPQSPKMPSTTHNEKEATAADRDRAARVAGADWARKVLGERFQTTSQGAGSNVSTPSAAHDGQGSAAHNKRNFADVVSALMEKEGIKPALWAEGALDTFGLGPSSSRNVADEAKRSRGAARSAAAKGVHIPQVVVEEFKQAKDGEEEQPVTPVSNSGESQRREVGREASHPLHANDYSSTTVVDDEEKTSRSESTTQMEGQDRGSNGDAMLGPNSGGAAEGAPGAQAYQQRHRRTLSTLSKASASERLAQITKSLDFANLSQVKGEITAEQLAAMADTMGEAVHEAESQGSDVLQFSPFIFHAPHAPVPMALVNRRPHGTPGHSDIRNPQDAAWLAGFRYAKKHIFLQSPTLNATPIKHAILHAARRHVRIEAYLGLGFNDKSESMPFQGGTNESVVTRLYRQLRREGKGDEKYLEVYCECML